jgi:hypothetical protein
LGNTVAVDRLFFASSVPLSVAGVTTGVLLYLLPPQLARQDGATQEATLRVLALAVVCLCALCAALAAVCTVATQSHSFWALLFGFSNIAGMLVLATLGTCMAQVRGQYLATGVAPLLTAAGLLAGTVAGIVFRLEWLLVIGQWLGAAAALSWLTLALRLPLRSNPKTDWLRCVDVLAPMRRYVAMIALGTIAFTLFQPIDAALCSQLDGGSVSIMSYAQRVLVAVSTVVSMGAHAIAARTSHDALRTGGSAALRRLANRECRQIVGFGLAVWLTFAYLARTPEPAAVLLLLYWALNVPVLGQEIAGTARSYPSIRNLMLRLLEPLSLGNHASHVFGRQLLRRDALP